MTTPPDPPPVFFDCNGVPPPAAGLEIRAWVCPLCEGLGRWEDGDRCAWCTGHGLVSEEPDPEDWPDVTIRRAPRPPAVAKQMCRDCAFRRRSPESERPPPLDRPFYCHRGTLATANGYSAPIMYHGSPIGEQLCAGWWWRATGDGQDPAAAAPYADTHPHKAFPEQEIS